MFIQDRLLEPAAEMAQSGGLLIMCIWDRVVKVFVYRFCVVLENNKRENQQEQRHSRGPSTENTHTHMMLESYFFWRVGFSGGVDANLIPYTVLSATTVTRDCYFVGPSG